MLSQVIFDELIGALYLGMYGMYGNVKFSSYFLVSLSIQLTALEDVALA